MKTLHGVVCATITPMYADGEIDVESAKSLYNYLAEKGIHCLYPNGTNGESLSLMAQERRLLAETAVQVSAGRQVVYVQCGAVSTQESYSHVFHAKKIGADGVGMMTPVFFAMDDLSIEQYYSEILEQIGDFPFYVYNIPTRTGNDVSPALLGRLMDRYPSVQGIKFSKPDLLYLQSYIHCSATRKADALIGCDPLAYCCMISGGAGWVSGPGAVFAKLFVSLYDAIIAKDMESAQQIQHRITQISNRMAGIPEIPAIKYMLCRLGVLCHDTVRRPLRQLTADEMHRLNQLLMDTSPLL